MLRFKKADGTSYPDWADMRLGDFLSESKIKGNTGDTAKKLTVRLWNKGVAPTNTLKSMGSENTQYYIRKVGQLIYGKQNVFRGAIGIIPKELDNYESTTDLPSFDIKDTLDSYFILLYLTREPYNRDLEIQASGTGSKRLHTDTFLNLQISLPCLEEQEKIADFFTAIDEKITLIDEQLSQLNLYKKAQLQGIFSPENTTNWANMRLGDVCELLKDGTHGTHLDVKNGIPLLSAKDIKNGSVLIPDDCRRISQEDFNKIHARYKIQDNDILLTIVGTIGRCSIVQNYEQQIFTLQRSVAIIRTNHLLNSKLLLHLLSSSKIQNLLDTNKSVSAQPGIYLGDLAILSITIPTSLEEQAKIADYLSALDDKITNTQQSLEQIKSYKIAMLQKMFT